MPRVSRVKMLHTSKEPIPSLTMLLAYFAWLSLVPLSVTISATPISFSCHHPLHFLSLQTSAICPSSAWQFYIHSSYLLLFHPPLRVLCNPLYYSNAICVSPWMTFRALTLLPSGRPRHTSSESSAFKYDCLKSSAETFHPCLAEMARLVHTTSSETPCYETCLVLSCIAQFICLTLLVVCNEAHQDRFYFRRKV